MMIWILGHGDCTLTTKVSLWTSVQKRTPAHIHIRMYIGSKPVDGLQRDVYFCEARYLTKEGRTAKTRYCKCAKSLVSIYLSESETPVLHWTSKYETKFFSVMLDVPMYLTSHVTVLHTNLNEWLLIWWVTILPHIEISNENKSKRMKTKKLELTERGDTNDKETWENRLKSLNESDMVKGVETNS